jgi:hypothetical protein
LTGTIVTAFVTTTYDPPRVCFNVKLDDGGSVMCRHKLDEKNAEANANGFAALGLSYPGDLAELEKFEGKAVKIRQSEYQGKPYYFLAAFNAAKHAEASAVATLIAKLAGQKRVAATDDSTPF